MKVLWLCNVPTPKAAETFGIKARSVGGWMADFSLATAKKCELYVAFPMYGISDTVIKSHEGISYCAVPNVTKKLWVYNSDWEMVLKGLLKTVTPDIIHIWGTEYQQALAMTKACQELGISDRAVIWIQGMTSVYAHHYMAQLPCEVQNGITFRNLIKNDSLKKQQQRFFARGEFEKQAIKNVKNILGRTNWDEACTGIVNPERRYFFCNETMRKEFYNKQWKIDECERHSIFVSQANYPIKGVHILLEAMLLIKDRYPDMKLYVGGENVLCGSSLKYDSYAKYLKQLIAKGGFEKSVVFTGSLDSEAMSSRYLKSNIFVSASSIENSSNSVCEAMLLGVPTVSGDVGGIGSLMTDGEDGLIYQYDSPYMLADCIIRLFESPELADKISQAARLRAEKRHDCDKNVDTLIGVYGEIIG